jgi:hypothetical protein
LDNVKTINRPLKMRFFAAAGLTLASLFALTGCFPGAGLSVNQLLRELAASQDPAAANPALTIRVVNQTAGLDELVRVEIDGEEETLFCSADEGTCDFLLVNLPSRVEAIEEERYNADGDFAGGRTFAGQPEWIFTTNEFTTGSIILFLLAEDEASAQVL